MDKRQIMGEMAVYLQEFPAVAILGPRQVGKTTLAHQLGTRPCIWISKTQATWHSSATLVFFLRRIQIVSLFWTRSSDYRGCLPCWCR